jgi:hypothetical protein
MALRISRIKYPVSNQVDTGKKLSGFLFPVFAVAILIVVWAGVSWFAWSQAGADWFKSHRAFQTAALPVLIMSWPAHEICLEISGAGFGANMRPAATFETFGIFLIQAMLTWDMLMMAAMVRKYYKPLLFAQLGVLIVLFVTFWYFGNG